MTTEELQALIDQWNEMFIRQVVDWRNGQKVTPQRLNELFNLLITQGDDTAETLALVRDYLRQYKIERTEADAEIIAHVDSVLAQVTASVEDVEANFTALEAAFNTFKTGVYDDISVFQTAVENALSAAAASNEALINAFKLEVNTTVANNKSELTTIVDTFVQSIDAAMLVLAQESAANRDAALAAVAALTETVDTYKQETIDASITAVEGIVDTLVDQKVEEKLQVIPGIGDITLLPAATGTDNLTAAVIGANDKAEQAFQSASDGKTAIATAITGVDPAITIPSNPTFQQLADCIEEIETDPYADKETKTGTSVQFTNADDALIAITAMGGTGSVDVVAMNNNVINPNRTPVTQSGITATMQEDKSYILNGTATAASGVFILGNTYSGSVVFTLRKGTYVLRGTGTSLLGIYLYKTDGTTINTLSNNLTFTLTTDTNFSSISLRWFTSSTNLNNVRVYPQVSFGTTLTTYEPHKENTLTIPDVTTAVYPLYLTSYKGITNVFTLSTGQPTFTAVAKSELWSGRKKVIPDAVQKADNSVAIPTDATFAQLAEAIGQIESGVDTSDATGVAADLLAPKTMYGADGTKVTGTMPTHDGEIITLMYDADVYDIPAGYHPPGNKVSVDIIGLGPDNVRGNTTVGGVAGTFTNDATALTSQVLAGKTYGAMGDMKTGTMVDRTLSENTALNLRKPATAGKIYLKPPAGFYDGINAEVAYTDGNFGPSNIKSGASIMGVTGTFSNDATALIGDVLEGKTFYRSGVKYTGTMPLRGSEVYSGWRQMEVSYPPTITGRVHFRIPLGAYLTGAPEQGGLLGLYMDDPGYKAENILSGKSIFGLAGTAVAGKRVASGSFVNSQGYADWTRLSDGGTLLGQGYRRISSLGLAFTPRLILYYVPDVPTTNMYVCMYFRDGFTYNGRTGYCSAIAYVVGCQSTPSNDYLFIGVDGTWNYIAYE